MSDEGNCCKEGGEHWIHVLGPRMATMLRRLEWAGAYVDDCDSLIDCCPVCNAEQDPPPWPIPKPPTGKHRPACDLAVLLRELP